MQLNFGLKTKVGEGSNPNIIHQPDNSLMAFICKDGKLQAFDLRSPTIGIYTGITFSNPKPKCKDISISRITLKHVPRKGVYGVWWQDDNPANDQRHRFAIWLAIDDLSDYLEEGVIEHSIDNAISTLSLSLENAAQYIAGESTAKVIPGCKLDISVSIGDATPVKLGSFYVDRSQMGVTENLSLIECRNGIGKKLKDQTFDQNFSFAPDRLDTTLYSICSAAGISSSAVYVQGPASFNVGMEFPRNMDFYSGILEVLKTSLNWAIKERNDGIIVIGSTLTYSEMPQNSAYEFSRGAELFSRKVVRDDEYAYAKVCVHDPTFVNYSYTNVNIQATWLIDPNKTLYIQVPEDTPLTEMQSYSADVASRLAVAGTIETFVGPLRPQLLIGDEAKIAANGQTPTLIGIITNIRHTFGKRGASTEFTVDSSGMKGKPQIKELISSIASKGTLASAKRL